MRVGSLVFATDQGLGILAKSFVDHGVVNSVMVVRHGKRETHTDWYPGAPIINDLRAQRRQIENWIISLDVFLAFETPFMWDLFDFAKSVGVKTVLMPMHECLHKDVWHHLPDLFLCPSLLDLRVVDDHQRNYKDMSYQSKVVSLPVPVEVPWRQRTRAEVFVHNAGHGGLKGRNGTKELLEATRLCKSPSKFVIRSQVPLPNVPLFLPGIDERVTFCAMTVPYNELYNEGDVFIFPEKFNGLSLPLQEARAAGMLVMCGDRFPMNTWLPTEPLIPVKSYNKGQRTFPQFHEFDEAVIDPRDIAAKIDEWYGRDITDYSLSGREWARSMSWDVLKPMYDQVFTNLTKESSSAG